MRLTTKGRYAVMALADIASVQYASLQGGSPEASTQAPPARNGLKQDKSKQDGLKQGGLKQGAPKAGERLVALSDIAIRQGISLSYLEQLFAKLRKAGLVSSTRGVSGGYELAAAPGDIRIAHIIAAVDEEIKTTACDQGSSVGCRGATGRCLTHDLWDELGRHIDIFLNAVTLEDIIEKRVLGMAAVNPPRDAARGPIPVPALGPVPEPIEAAE